MKLRVPTELSDKQIEEFQRIYKKEHGEELSKEEAHELGLSLVRLVALIIDKNETQHKSPSISKG